MNYANLLLLLLQAIAPRTAQNPQTILPVQMGYRVSPDTVLIGQPFKLFIKVHAPTGVRFEAGVLRVSDDGRGVEEEELPRLFERFYRSDRARASRGTGLGLAIVKHVLIRHQAELAIDSAPGQGSRFTVRLPARRVNVVPEMSPASATF